MIIVCDKEGRVLSIPQGWDSKKSLSSNLLSLFPEGSVVEEISSRVSLPADFLVRFSDYKYDSEKKKLERIVGVSEESRRRLLIEKIKGYSSVLGSIEELNSLVQDIREYIGLKGR